MMREQHKLPCAPRPPEPQASAVWHRFPTGEVRQTRLTDVRPAFSLLELITVVIIIATLATIAAPRFSNALAGNSATIAANRIALDIALAQQRARSRSAAQTISFNAGAHKYTLAGMPHPDHPATDYAVELSREPYGASITNVEFKADSELAGDPNLVFDPFGKPDSGGSVQIKVGAHAKTITVDADTGKATIS